MPSSVPQHDAPDGVIRSPLLTPKSSEARATSALPADYSGSFDALVYQFTTNSKTLTAEERLEFLKQSKKSLEKMESPALRQTLDQAQRSRERVQAARSTPRAGTVSPPPPATALRTGKRESLATNAPLMTGTSQRPRGPFLTLDEEAVDEEKRRKHSHYLVAESPRQIYSVRGEGAAHTPQKVTLGEEEKPTVLNDFFPEPVRNRQRRRGSYAKYQPSAMDSTPSGPGEREGGTRASGRSVTSGRGAPPKSPRAAGSPVTPRRGSIVVLAVHTPDLRSTPSALADAQDCPLPTERLMSGRRSGGSKDASLTSPTSTSQPRLTSLTGNAPASPNTRGTHPFSLHTRVSSHLPVGASTGTSAHAKRSQSAGGQRRRGSFTSRRRAHTPQAHSTFSRNSTPPGGAATPTSPMGLSVPSTTGFPLAAPVAKTPRRGSMTSARSLKGDRSPRLSLSQGGHAPECTTPTGSAAAVVPALDVADLTPRASRARGHSFTNTGTSRSANATQETLATPPHTGNRTTRNRRLMQAQRTAILELLNAEIGEMQGDVGSPSESGAAVTDNVGPTKNKVVGEDAVASPDDPPPTSAESHVAVEPILVADLSAFPDVAHAVTLLEGNACSAFNWVMLAESMSEAQLLPPHAVRVVYKPDADPGAAAARALPPADEQGYVTRWVGMKDALVEALDIDNDMKNAWEGLALLLAPDEKVVVRKARTGRPITVNNVACYVRLLRADPSYFYGWMGLGCAMVEEQKKLVEEARAAEAQTKAMEALAEHDRQEVAQPPAPPSAAATPAPSAIRRGRREPAMTLDDGLRLLEEEERNARRATRTGAASRPGKAATHCTDTSRIKSDRVGGAVATNTTPDVPLSIPAVTHDVLFGQRPFEAKDCFAHAAQLCPWEGSIWLQILMTMPDAAATVEFDAPADEREWADLVGQRSTLAMLGTDVLGPPAQAPSLGDTEHSAETAESLRSKMIAMDDERLLKGCVLTFVEVAGIALELNGSNADVWRYVGQRLPRSDAPGTGGRLRRASMVKQHTTMTSAGLFVTTLNASTPSSVQKRGRRSSMKGTAAPASSSGVVCVFGEPFTREQCFRRAKDLAARGN